MNRNGELYMKKPRPRNTQEEKYLVGLTFSPPVPMYRRTDSRYHYMDGGRWVVQSQ